MATAQAGRTFKYTENCAVGLAGGKQVIVCFFGITDVRFVRAEGVNLGEEAVQRAMQEAIASIDELAAVAA